MQAIHVSTNPDASKPYSVENPAPSTALKLSTDTPIPQPKVKGDMIVRMKAASVIRDCLTWPEMYSEPNAIPGNDFAGIVDSVSDGCSFKKGDEVWGMVAADRPATWAQYGLVKEIEASIKPHTMSFAQAAAIPLSALTAYEALFEQAHLAHHDFDAAKNTQKKRVLITGASGAVGTFIVQLAALAGHHVVGASSSNARNKTTLEGLGATEACEYDHVFGGNTAKFDAIIDCTGGSNLEKCWTVIAENGYLVTIDSSSYEFVEEHKKAKLPGTDTKGVNALFFIVSAQREPLDQVAKLIDRGALKLAGTVEYPLAKAVEAYDAAHARTGAVTKGKVVLTIA